MEDNLHEDKLDDYVRRSFEGHEEAPPDDMWARVEADIFPPEPSGMPRRTWVWKTLSVGVIALLLSMLVCEHLYYTEKIREFRLRDTPAAVQKTEQRVTEPIPTESISNESSTQPVPAQRSSSKPQSEPQTKARADFQPPQRTDPDETPTSSVTPKRGDNAAIVPGGKTLPIDAFGTQIRPEQQENELDLPTAEGAIADIPTLITWDWIVPRNTNLLSRTNTVLPLRTPHPPSIKPQRKPSDWYVGASVATLWAVEQQHIPTPRFGRPAFVSEREQEGASALWGLGVGKKLSHRFSLETGLAYQKIRQSSTHTARFRFRDGTPAAMRRNFVYDLSTYGGTAAMSLRMETTPGPPPSDNEPVVLKINTEQRIELLRIPLLAKFDYGQGRLSGYVKAGLLGNVVISNELDISARRSQNARFQPVAGIDGYTVQLSQDKFFFGYWFSSGVDYRLSRGISFFAEPALLGDFPRSDQQRRRLPERMAYGLNVGARLIF